MRARTREQRARLAELRSLTCFSHCAEEQLHMIDNLGAAIVIRPGRRIDLSGGPRSLCVVRSGLLIVHTPVGRVMVGRGELLPLTPGDGAYTATALEPTDLLAFTPAESLRVLDALYGTPRIGSVVLPSPRRDVVTA